jgi:hypothetical protein
VATVDCGVPPPSPALVIGNRYGSFSTLAAVISAALLVVVAVLVLVGAARPGALVAAPVAGVAVTLIIRARSFVAVTADGVTLTQIGRQRSTIPWSNVAAMVPHRWGTTLALVTPQPVGNRTVARCSVARCDPAWRTRAVTRAMEERLADSAG